jgi:hypothetical protein
VVLPLKSILINPMRSSIGGCLVTVKSVGCLFLTPHPLVVVVGSCHEKGQSTFPSFCTSSEGLLLWISHSLIAIVIGREY